MKYVLKQKNKIENIAEVDALTRALVVSPMLGRILYGRGLETEKEAREFLQPDRTQLHDPFLFRAMADSVSTVKNVIAKKGSICIYGDYDVDGTAACAILYRTLINMGAHVDCYLPNRMEHGYGLSMDAIEKIKDYELLITVDCGITNVAEIAKAKEYGVKTIITDHHECTHVLPKADYIINPKCPGETYPYPYLCGAGVAFKLAYALAGDAAFAYIDLAAVATIADIVPLTQENRVIAKLGLDKLNTDPNKGIAALFRKTGMKRDVIDSQMISYSLAPRINAAGRISTAKIAFELMSKTDEAKLEELAQELCDLNADRQGRQETVVRQAMAMDKGAPDSRVILLYKKDWDVGIVGLAASRLAEKYNKPTILFGETAGLFTGSARSIDGVDIYKALATQADLYEKFGGHAGAAGLTIKQEYLDVLRDRLDLYLKNNYTADVFRPVRYFDVELKLNEISGAQIRELELLKPYGHKNEQVDVLVRNVDIAGVKAIGEDKHAKFSLRKKADGLSAVYFGMQAQNVPRRADVIGSIRINQFDGKPQMIVQTLSFEPSHAQRFAVAADYIARAEAPEDKAVYFCNREKLLEVFTVLKRICDKGMDFADMNALLLFIRKYVKRMTDEKFALALCVLEEIKLLTIKKGDKIQVVVYPGKHDLDESPCYKKFYLEGIEDGFKGKNQKYK